MWKNNLWLISLSLMMLSSTAFSQVSTDVCCVLGKTDGQGAQVYAQVRSSTDCRKGQKADDYTVCTAIPDPENLCPTFETNDLCGRCGYHWTGTTCLSEDPVKAAKEQLKKEKDKKSKSTSK